MLIRTDTLQPWRGETLKGVRHPPNIEALWNAQALAAIGVVKAIPEGFRAVGPASYAADGMETIPQEPIPEPTAEKIDAEKEERLGEELATPTFRVLFAHENRIRVLEGRDPIEALVFRASLKGRL
jgi:hypothetical protein